MGKVSSLSGLTGSWFRVCPVSDFEFSGFQGSDLEFSVCSFRFPVFGFACGFCPPYWHRRQQNQSLAQPWDHK